MLAGQPVGLDLPVDLVEDGAAHAEPGESLEGEAVDAAQASPAVEFDLDGVKASMGLEPTVNRVTYRELQERRELIQKRMREHVEAERPKLGR